VIAAIASASAALIVSRVWGAGTIFASAFTPVIVALVSEGLRKPVESDLVKRPISKARSAVTSSTPAVFEDRSRSADAEPDPNEIRIYSTGSNKARTSPRRKLHYKVALVTGLVAFLIAALALTLPELIFGQSVVNRDRGTTVFGGGSSKSSSSTSDEKKDEESSGDSTEQSTDEQQDETTPQDSGSSEETTPPEEGAGGTEIDPAPSGEQTTPATPTTPAPTTPAPTTPVPTTPAPTP
jgi:hypothetical protein